MTDARYADLGKITEYLLTRDMARLAEINARARRLHVSRLALGHAAVAELPKPGPRAPADLQCYAKWQTWSDQSRRRIAEAEAELAEERAAALKTLKRSFGQGQVVAHLRVAAERLARRERIARAERDGRPPED
ncbi:MAG: hypothetical protein AAFY59_01365 [Pseudomonadota bacterium]